MKCFFDNNMPIKLAQTLNLLEGNKGISVAHLREKFPADTPDIVWIQKLREEKDWFIITKDNQIRKRQHERKVWQESHIPIVFLQKAWMNRTFWEMTWRLIKYWPELKKNIEQYNTVENFELSIQGKIVVVK